MLGINDPQQTILSALSHRVFIVMLSVIMLNVIKLSVVAPPWPT